MNPNSLISDIHQCCCIPATSDEIIDTINQVEEALVPDTPDEPEPTGDPEIIFTFDHRRKILGLQPKI